MRASPFLVVAAAMMFTSAGPTPDARAGTAPDIERGIVYSRPGGVPLRLDAYVPGSPGPHPAVVLIHGGAWREGDRELSGNWYATAFVRSGFAAFAVDYRLAPEHPFPAAVHDVRAAVAWVRAHAAEFDVDPTAIGAFGESAGGHLAAMLTILGSGPLDDGSRVVAAVSWSGPMDLAALVRERGDLMVRGHDGSFELTVRDVIEQFLGCEDRSCSASYRTASPVTFVDPTDAPMFLVHSVNEDIPISQAREMADRLRAAGVPARLLELPGSRHGVEYSNDPVPGSSGTVLEASIAFLSARLGGAPGQSLEASSSGTDPPPAVTWIVLALALAIAVVASPLLLPGSTAKRSRLLVRPAVRTVRWLPLAPIAAIGVAAIWLSFHTSAEPNETHLPYAGFLLAVWLGFVLDDPAAEITGPVPTPLLLRRGVTLAVSLPPVIAIWGVLLVYAGRAGWVDWSLSLNLAAQFLVAVAFGALGARTAGEERAGMVAAGGLVIVFFVLPTLLRLPVPSYQPGASTWMQLYGRSLVIAAISVPVFLALSRDRPHRSALRLAKRTRPVTARGWVG